MDLLTGQNKANFKTWYTNWQEQNDYYKAFHKLPFAMQEGVLKEYYRGFGYDIHTYCTRIYKEGWVYFSEKFDSVIETARKYETIGKHKTYEEAMKQAFKSADELINQTTTP